jgi:hypothetical protein
MSSDFADFVTHARIETASQLSGMTWSSVSTIGLLDDAAFIRVQLRDNRQKRNLVSVAASSAAESRRAVRRGSDGTLD